MIYTHTISAILGAAIAATGAWQVQNWRYGKQIAEIHAEQAKSTANAVTDALTKERDNQKRKDDALQKAQSRAQENAAAADSARRTADSLRDELAAARRDLSSASADTARNYAAAVTEVFGQCSERLTEVAREADGHASDSLMYQNAWPH